MLVDRYSLAKVIEEKKANRKLVPRTTAVEETSIEESNTRGGRDPDFIPDEEQPY
jgi:hypothetical protein